jgi:twitching motility protein PilT
MRLIVSSRLVHIVTVEDPIEFLLTDNLGAVTQREIGTDTPSYELALRNVLRQDPDVIMVGEMRDPSTIQTVLTAAETGHLVFSTVHTNSSARAGLSAAIEIMIRTPRIAKLILEGNLEALDEEIENSVMYHKMQSMNQSLSALVLNRQITLDTALGVSSNPGDLDLILRKFLYAAEAQTQEETDEMAEPLSDFSKILELQEIKKAYEEQQERHQADLAEKDEEIARLREMSSQEPQAAPDSGEAAQLREERNRLSQQIQRVRQEYEAKIERLNARIRELSAGSGERPVAATDSERRGFFRR